MYKDIALVLEGGGMRGAYSSGVLDVMHDNGLKFGGYAGTSAGATHICSFMSEQRERNMRIDTVHSQDPRYMGFKQLIKTGDYFPREFCYITIPREIDPFDYAKFEENAKVSDFYSVATNLETGEAEYLLTQEVDKGDGLECVRASASLPLMSKIVELRGMKLLDGGIGDSIPFGFMERKGFKKQVVILTQQEGYVKKPNSLIPLFKLMYRKYPKFVEAAATRHIRYNEALAKLKENEKAGKSFVFRPSEPFKISRIEKDASKLVELYKMGLKDGEANMPRLKEFLGL
ncbi:MAG: patatin family protein [Fibrobacter sp.]|nr:patatin family protein [Fibrobacter sp.]